MCSNWRICVGCSGTYCSGSRLSVITVDLNGRDVFNNLFSDLEKYLPAMVGLADLWRSELHVVGYASDIGALVMRVEGQERACVTMNDFPYAQEEGR